MSTLDDLAEPLTVDEFKTSIYDVIYATGVDVTAWKPGAVTRTIIAAVAIVGSACSVLISLVAKSAYLAFARGYWLTLLAKYYYGLAREPATQGRGFCKLVNLGGGDYTWDPEEFVITNLDTGKTYWNTAAVHLAPNATLTDVEFIAVESGAASTSTVGTVTGVDSAYEGLVTVTNTTSIVGRDEELDEDLIIRCWAQLDGRSAKGPNAVYEKAAREARRLDGALVGVNRVRVVPDGYGNVYTYLAGPSGGISGTAEDVSTDLGAANDAIQRKAAPLSVTAVTRSSTEQTVNFIYKAYLRTDLGLTAAQANALFAARLAQYAVNPTLSPIGGIKLDEEPGKFFLEAAARDVTKAIPDGVWHFVFTSPANDVVLDPAAVVKVGSFTGEVVFTDQAVANG